MSNDKPAYDEAASLSAAWLQEIERQIDAVKNGEATTPWPEIRDAALARLASSDKAKTREAVSRGPRTN